MMFFIIKFGDEKGRQECDEILKAMWALVHEEQRKHSWNLDKTIKRTRAARRIERETAGQTELNG